MRNGRFSIYDMINRIVTNWRLIAFSLAGVIVISGLLSVIIFVPRYQSNEARRRINEAIDKLDPIEQAKERLQLEREITAIENSARTTIAQIIGGLVILFGLYFTYKNLSVTEEGKLTDRFSKAVELLGSKELDVRLGGIYALERIAKDSQKDHRTVMEVLTAYVREHSPRKEEEESQEVSLNGIFKPIELPIVSTDIQAVLTVIGRRKRQNNEYGVIDLSHSWLMRADLNNADLGWADLNQVNLRLASLNRANLSRAFLIRTDLRGAMLRGANLSGAHLLAADISGAHLIEANLSEAHLTGADFSKASLCDADLRGADLRGANLTTVTFATWDQIKNARIDETTQLPPEMKSLWEQSQKKESVGKS
jgi:hypothetical protein